MVLISFPHPQPIFCPYSKNMQYPTQARNADPSTDQQRLLRWHPMHAHGRKSFYCSRAPAKANWHPKKGVSVRYWYIPSPLPPAGYLHLLYNSRSQRVFWEFLRVPEILSGGLLGQNYFYNNTGMLVASSAFIHECVEWRFERLQ